MKISTSKICQTQAKKIVTEESVIETQTRVKQYAPIFLEEYNYFQTSAIERIYIHKKKKTFNKISRIIPLYLGQNGFIVLQLLQLVILGC